MQDRYSKLVKSAVKLAVVAAGFLLIVKTLTWWFTGSVSLLASMMDTLLDMSASSVNLLVVRYALQPADKEHTFGHGKAESLAALAQAAFISLSSAFLIYSSVQRFIHPTELDNLEYGIYTSLFAMVVTLGLVMYQRYVIKETGSQAIKADELHYRTDLYMNGVVIIALGFTYIGWYQADAVFAVLIGMYIFRSALQIAQEAISTLLDQQLPSEELEQIIELAKSDEAVLGAHQVRTRKSGQTRFIQLHLELPDELKLIEAHEIADRVEDKIIEAFPASDVMIHLDPYSVTLDKERIQKEQPWI